MLIRQHDAVTELRRLLDEVVLSENIYGLDSSVLSNSSSLFSDEDLIDRLESSSIFVLSRCSPKYFTEFKKTINRELTPPELKTENILWIIDKSCRVNGKEAKRKTMSSNEKTKSRGYSYTSDTPIYVYEDLHFFTETDVLNPTGSEIDVIYIPSEIGKGGEDFQISEDSNFATLVGDTIDDNDIGGNVIFFDGETPNEIFSSGIVANVSNIITMSVPSNMTRNYGNWQVRNTIVSKMPILFKEIIIRRSLQKCLEQIHLLEHASEQQNIISNLLTPYLITSNENEENTTDG